jgi:hypothetical protein
MMMEMETGTENGQPYVFVAKQLRFSSFPFAQLRPNIGSRPASQSTPIM